MLLPLLIAVLWSPAGKGLSSWLLFVMFLVFFTFPCGILGQVWYFIVSFPDLCQPSQVSSYGTKWICLYSVNGNNEHFIP